MPTSSRAAPIGVVELHVAFSRAGERKIYVQDLIARAGGRVWRLLDGGAIVYVCGDGSRMEPDVKRALMALHQERAGGDEAEARRWIDDLGAKNRYVLDVWGGELATGVSLGAPPGQLRLHRRREQFVRLIEPPQLVATERGQCSAVGVGEIVADHQSADRAIWRRPRCG